MRRVVLANETDWEGWRKATRSLVLAGVAPEDVRWAVRSHDEEGDPLQEEVGTPVRGGHADEVDLALAEVLGAARAQAVDDPAGVGGAAPEAAKPGRSSLVCL